MNKIKLVSLVKDGAPTEIEAQSQPQLIEV